MEFKIIQTNFHNNMGDHPVVKNCKIMGSQPADVLHDRAEKGGGQMTQRAANGVRTITWLFLEHSVLVYDVCKLKPHEHYPVIYLALA